MASSKVVTTNPDLPRDSSISSLSALLSSDLQPNNNNTSSNIIHASSITMDDLLKSIYSSSSDPNFPSDPSSAAAGDTAGASSSTTCSISRQGSLSLPKDMAAKTVDEVWKEIVAGSESQSQRSAGASAGAGESLEEMTLEDFLTKAGAVREEDVRGIPNLVSAPGSYPVDAAAAAAAAAGINGGAQFAMPAHPIDGSSVETFGNGIDGTVVGVQPPPPPPAAASGGGGGGGGKGKRRVVEEPLDKATLQKQRRMIKNRESAARSRERKQAYTVELEYLVTQLEEENARLLREEAEMNKQRLKQLMEFLIPVEEKRKPRRMLRRVNSVQW